MFPFDLMADIDQMVVNELKYLSTKVGDLSTRYDNKLINKVHIRQVAALSGGCSDGNQQFAMSLDGGHLLIGFFATRPGVSFKLVIKQPHYMDYLAMYSGCYKVTEILIELNKPMEWEWAYRDFNEERRGIWNTLNTNRMTLAHIDEIDCSSGEGEYGIYAVFGNLRRDVINSMGYSENMAIAIWNKREINAACVIQRAFRMAMCCPRYAMCKRRLMMEFGEMAGG